MKWLLMLLLTLPSVAVAQSMAPMAKTLMAGVPHSTGTRVAVLEFSYDGDTSGSSVVQERLTAALVNGKLGTVVERRLIDRVLGELKFQRAGMVDEATVKELGRILGVDYVVTGTISDIKGEKAEVNARLINAETAAVISAASVVVERVWGEEAKAEAAPKPSKGKGMMATHEYLNAQLAELKKGIGTDIMPFGGGKVYVNGEIVDGQDFSKAVMKTLVDGAKAQGLQAPPSAEKEKP